MDSEKSYDLDDLLGMVRDDQDPEAWEQIRLRMDVLKNARDEAERLLRLSCENVCGKHVEDNSLKALRKGRSPELADISLAIESVCLRLRGERDNLLEQMKGRLHSEGELVEVVKTQEETIKALERERDEARSVADYREAAIKQIPDLGDDESYVEAVTRVVEERDQWQSRYGAALARLDAFRLGEKAVLKLTKMLDGLWLKMELLKSLLATAWSEQEFERGDKFLHDDAARLNWAKEEVEKVLAGLGEVEKPEPSEDLKAAVERRFKSIMRLVYDYGKAKEEGSSLLKMSETNVRIEIQKLVESGLKFASEGPVFPYVLKADRDKPPEEQTVFYLRNCSPEELRRRMRDVAEINWLKDQAEYLEKAGKFVDHIKAHLKEGEPVLCKICGKTVEEIALEGEKEKDAVEEV